MNQDPADADARIADAEHAFKSLRETVLEAMLADDIPQRIRNRCATLLMRLNHEFPDAVRAARYAMTQASILTSGELEMLLAAPERVLERAKETLWELAYDSQGF